MAKAENYRKIVFFSVLAYIVFLLAMFPLNVAYKLIDPKGLPVQVLAVSGTVWNGEVTVKHQMTGQMSAQWQLNMLPLLMGSLQSSLKVEGADLNAQLEASFNPITQNVSLSQFNGFVQAGLVNRIAKRNRVTLSGDLEISNVSVNYNLSDKFASDASGRIVWMGGNVSYPKGRKKGQANLPMLIADLSEDSGALNVNVHTTENLAVATANLKTDGWGNVAVLKRMIDLVGEPWPNKASPDTAVFEISEKVF